jgi:hypothetical protein
MVGFIGVNYFVRGIDQINRRDVGAGDPELARVPAQPPLSR